MDMDKAFRGRGASLEDAAGRAWEGYELESGKLCPTLIKQKLVMGWKIITEE